MCGSSLRTTENFKMVSQIISCLSQSSSLLCLSDSRRLILPKTCTYGGLSRFSPGFASRRLFTVNRKKWRSACIFNSGKEPGGEGKLQGGSSEWPILQRWEVPWGWQTVSLTSFACALRQFCFDRINRDGSHTVFRNRR